MNAQEKEKIMQKAVQNFCQNEYWKGIYDAAPGLAKKYYAVSFVFSTGAFGGDAAIEAIAKEFRNELYGVYREMNDAEWEYVIQNASGPSKIGLHDARVHMQGKPAGTEFGWWRER